MASVDCTVGQRGAAVDGIRAVRVAQPVRRYSYVDAGLPGRALDHAVDGELGQVAAFSAGEERRIACDALGTGHLNDNKHAMVAAKIANEHQGRPWPVNPPNGGFNPVTQERAADLMNVTKRS